MQYQVTCLQAAEGSSSLFLKKWYDDFPPELRRALQNAPINVCDACVFDIQRGHGTEVAIKFVQSITHR